MFLMLDEMKKSWINCEATDLKIIQTVVCVRSQLFLVCGIMQRVISVVLGREK